MVTLLIFCVRSENASKESVDVGIAALAFAKELHPKINIAAYSKKIDSLTEKVRRLSGGSENPDYRIRCLNTVLLKEEKFQRTREVSRARSSENYFLHHVLDTKKGNCVSMPLLYIAVSQRLGWPVYLVHVPDHSFVRYVDPSLKEQNIETTSNGGYVSDEVYSKDFSVRESDRKNGTYLRTLSHQELLGDLTAINGITLARQGHLNKAVPYLELAIRMNPRNAAAKKNLATATRQLASLPR